MCASTNLFGTFYLLYVAFAYFFFFLLSIESNFLSFSLLSIGLKAIKHLYSFSGYRNI